MLLIVNNISCTNYFVEDEMPKYTLNAIGKSFMMRLDNAPEAKQEWKTISQQGYVEVNEAYTSGTSYLDDEVPTKENYNKKRRITRGLFQAEDMLINADVNGSLQIMRKVFPDSYTGYGIEVDLTPIIINVVKAA